MRPTGQPSGCSQYPQFDPSARAAADSPADSLPWMFDDYVGLRPLKEAAAILAGMDDWPMLGLIWRRYATARCLESLIGYGGTCTSGRPSQSRRPPRFPTATVVGYQCRHNGLRANGAKSSLDRLLKRWVGERLGARLSHSRQVGVGSVGRPGQSGNLRIRRRRNAGETGKR